MAFNSFSLHADIVRGIKDLGFTKPTPIQKDAIPAALDGRDVLACSATGSGKTAAFVLPILNHLIAQPRGTIRALILTPTRELAAQITEHIADLGRHTKITSASVYGGVSMGPQRHAFERGVDILVATPGRLLDHLSRPYAKLNKIEILVLDEADRMLDMGFLPDIRRILRTLPAKKQVLFFSATMPSQIISMTKELLHNPASISLERTSKPASGITQTLYPVPQARKTALLAKLVESANIRNALVFTRTKRRADRVADFLKGIGVTSGRIHGDRTQSQRTQAMEAFKRGRYKILVATDVAARGIDIDALSHVINFDIPGTPEDYIHRIGRTARAEAKGDAFTFVSPDEESDLRAIERVLGAKVPRVVVPDFDYSVSESEARMSRPRPQGRGGYAGRSGSSGHSGSSGRTSHARSSSHSGSSDRTSHARPSAHSESSDHTSHARPSTHSRPAAHEGHGGHGGHVARKPEEKRVGSYPWQKPKAAQPASGSKRPWEKPNWKPHRPTRHTTAKD